MAGHMRWAVAVGLFAAGLAPGCAATGSKGNAAPAILVGPEARGAAPAPELPPKAAAVACLASARELDANGKIDEAIALYERARGLDPAHAAPAGRRLGVLYEVKGEHAKADAEYQRALAAAPKDIDLLNDIGYGYYCRGKLDRAEEYLARATELDPANKRAWSNRALVAGMQGRSDDCLAYFGRVVPEAEARCNLAFLLASRQKTAEAVAEYRQALALSPDLTIAKDAVAKLTDSGARQRSPEKVGPAAAAAPSP
jgi:Flp pilus assembly protein TadD